MVQVARDARSVAQLAEMLVEDQGAAAQAQCIADVGGKVVADGPKATVLDALMKGKEAEVLEV